MKKAQVKCYCGCGKVVKSRFAQGHDAKFKALAIRVAKKLTGIRAALSVLPEGEARRQFRALVDSNKS